MIFVREHIVRGEWKHRVRPVLLNSWEAAYFKINGHKLLKLAKPAYGATGYDREVRYFQDFGSRMYFMEAPAQDIDSRH